MNKKILRVLLLLSLVSSLHINSMDLIKKGKEILQPKTPEKEFIVFGDLPKAEQQLKELKEKLKETTEKEKDFKELKNKLALENNKNYIRNKKNKPINTTETTATRFRLFKQQT
ncbi:hypothetical protein ACFLYU_05120 [Candidatus Dependentiae bacterium]